MAKYKYDKYEVAYEEVLKVSDSSKATPNQVMIARKDNDHYISDRSVWASDAEGEKVLAYKVSGEDGFGFHEGDVNDPSLNITDKWCMLVKKFRAHYSRPSRFTGDIYKIEHKKGRFIETVVAEEGSLPDNNIKDGYWYVKGEKAFPSLKLKSGDREIPIGGGIWKDSQGVEHPISNIYYKDNEGRIRQVK